MFSCLKHVSNRAHDPWAFPPIILLLLSIFSKSTSKIEKRIEEKLSNKNANDKVFNTVELFTDGLINKIEAIRRLKYEKPNLQISLRTKRSLDYLHFKRSEKLWMLIQFFYRKNILE